MEKRVSKGQSVGGGEDLPLQGLRREACWGEGAKVARSGKCGGAGDGES